MSAALALVSQNVSKMSFAALHKKILMRVDMSRARSPGSEL